MSERDVVEIGFNPLVFLIWIGAGTTALWFIDKAATCLARIIVKLYFAIAKHQVYKSDVV